MIRITAYNKCMIRITAQRKGSNQMQKLNYTAAEACEAASVSIPTLRKWTRTPGFPVIRAGKKILIPVNLFHRWLEEQAKGGKVL